MPTECVVCKTVNADTASFCNNCGARLGKVPEETSATPGPAKPPGLPEALPQQEHLTQRPDSIPEYPTTLEKKQADPGSSGWSPLQPTAMPASGPVARFLTSAKNLAQGGTRERELEGTVRRFSEVGDWDNQHRPRYVRTFVLESFDPLGNRRPPVQVEMRARRFDGWINEGDEVVISQFKQQEGRILASEVRNKTTHATVRAKGSQMWPPPMWVWDVIWLAGLALILYQCLRA